MIGMGGAAWWSGRCRASQHVTSWCKMLHNDVHRKVDDGDGDWSSTLFEVRLDALEDACGSLPGRAEERTAGRAFCINYPGGRVRRAGGDDHEQVRVPRRLLQPIAPDQIVK